MSAGMTLRKPATGSVSGRRRLKVARLTRRYLEDFWRWWTGELRPLMPPALRALVFHEHLRELIEPESGGFRISRADAADQPPQIVASDGGDVSVRTSEAAERVLVLPRDRVLCRRAVLPLAAEENLREVLAFEMDRLTPFTADQVYYDARITDRDTTARMLTLELLVAPRCEVDPLLNRLAAVGLTPRIVTAGNANDAEVLAFNLLSRPGGSTWRTVTRVNMVVTAVAALLLGISAAVPLIEKQRRLAELEPQLAQAISEAAEARNLESQVDRLVSGSSYLVNRKRQSVSVLATLNALTQALPEHTWVERLDVEGRSVRIQGVSGSAEELIGLLERSAEFENVSFESPVVRHDRQAVDRFHISAEIEQGGSS